ncbi:MAG: DedA family protein [bacterium]|nr:DedA family protein [bacterium]
MLEIIGSFALYVIDASGYAGIFFLMALESAAIPIPSEIIMPFSGFLVAQGSMNFWFVVLAGTFGNLFGSLVLYAVAFYGGRPALRKYGRYVFLSESHVESAEQWFYRYGSFAAFFGRMLPIVRTYISFPVGLGRMNIWKFSLYTSAGSFLWAIFLTWVGFALGERWQTIQVYTRKFDIVIAVIIGIGIIYFFWSHIRKKTA